MSKTDWKNPDTYTFPNENDRHAWAWEFLRRNEEYKKDYQGLQKEQKNMTEKYGDDKRAWFKDDRWIRYSPEKYKDESHTEWVDRIFDIENEVPEEITLAEELARKWGIVTSMQDPSSDLHPKFYSWTPKSVLVDEDTIKKYVQKTDDGFFNYGKYIVIAIDLEYPLKGQIDHLSELMIKIAERRKIQQKRQKGSSKLWSKYIRMIDAMELPQENMPSTKLLLKTLFPEFWDQKLANDKEPIPANLSARLSDTKKQAIKMMQDGYRKIII